LKRRRKGRRKQERDTLRRESPIVLVYLKAANEVRAFLEKVKAQGPSKYVNGCISSKARGAKGG